MVSKLDRVGDWKKLAEDADFEVQKLAALSHVSVRQLDRFFRRSFGESPELWMKRFRVKQAQARLLRGNGVKETAYALKFKQVSHFSREFKKFTGSTPQSFGATRHRRTDR